MNLKLQFPKSVKSLTIDKPIEEIKSETPIAIETVPVVETFPNEKCFEVKTMDDVVKSTEPIKQIVIDVKPNEVIEIDLVVTIANFQLPKTEVKSGMPAFKLSISGAHKAVLIVNKWPIANRQNITLMIAVAQELSKKLSGVGGTKQKVNIRDEAKNLICSVTLNEIEWQPQYKNIQREYNPQDAVVEQIRKMLNPQTSINQNDLENEITRVFQ